MPKNQKMPTVVGGFGGFRLVSACGVARDVSSLGVPVSIFLRAVNVCHRKLR